MKKLTWILTCPHTQLRCSDEVSSDLTNPHRHLYWNQHAEFEQSEPVQMCFVLAFFSASANLLIFPKLFAFC